MNNATAEKFVIVLVVLANITTIVLLSAALVLNFVFK